MSVEATGATRDIFDVDDFEPIKYINEKFPDEASLINLDAVISDLRAEVSKLDDEILEGIHEHAMLNTQMKEEIANTKNLTSTIVQEIKSIKEKAIESESIVHDMCMDIKLLDTAKRNLSTSINTLRKFSDLMRSLDNMEEFCAKRQYDDAANCLKGINDLLLFFKPYESIPQIKEMIEVKDDILKKAKEQIKDDFALFFQGNSSLSFDTLKNGCHLVEILGQKFRNDILMMPAELILDPYRKIYQKPENCNIENVEQRYAWFVRELRDFNEKYIQAFPHYWGMLNYIVQSFCAATKIQINEILQGSNFKDSNDVKNLLNSLRATIKFETKMSEDLLKEYQQYLNEEKNPQDERSQYRISQLYKTKGSISGCFEYYMRPYVDSEKQELEGAVLSELQKDLNDPMSNSIQTESEEVRILNSALLMFNKLRHLLKRGSSISKSQTMFDIYKVVKNTITTYCNMIIDDSYKKEKNKGKQVAFFLASICVYINTLDHIKETLGNVNDLIVTMLEPPYNEQIEFTKEEDNCLELINELIVMVKKIIDAGLENTLVTQFGKVQWDRYDDHGNEISKYVVETKDVVKSVVDVIRGKIGPVHLTKILNMICQNLNLKYIASILKLKKISDGGINQLSRDFNELSKELDILGRGPDGEQISKIYAKFFHTTMEKGSAIIKMMATNNAQMPQTIQMYKDKITPQEMEKILTNKGFKKNEITNLLSTVEST